MWSMLKYRLFHKYDTPAKGINDLWERIGETWYEITSEDCKKFIRKMPERCRAVIENNGLYTDYLYIKIIESYKRHLQSHFHTPQLKCTYKIILCQFM